MFKTLAQLWRAIQLTLETVSSGTRTINNFVTTAEEYSASFKKTSLSELHAQEAQAEFKANNKIAALIAKEARS
jgi:pyruvate/2-oxoglutarate dehydrogenase complex dihydrolipoamide acyltransferase (E2) component